jgi:hypothetical protein
MTKHRRDVGSDITFTAADLERMLNPTELAQLERDAEMWRKLGSGAHLDEILGMSESFWKLRTVTALRVNADKGRRFNTAYSKVLTTHFPHFPDGWITDVLWLTNRAFPERMETLVKIREDMTPGERARLNAPGSARQRVRLAMEAADAKQAAKAGVEIKKKPTPVQARDEIIRKLNEKVAQLERRTDGSLFDLKHDTSEAISTVIASTISESRWRDIVKRTNAAFKKRQQAPGG